MFNWTPGFWSATSLDVNLIMTEPHSVTYFREVNVFWGNDPQDYFQVGDVLSNLSWYVDRTMISNKHSWRKLQDLMIEPLLPHVFQLVKPQNARAPEDPHVPFLMVKTPRVWCRCSIFDEIWLMVQTFFIFHIIWDNPSHWLSYFSEGYRKGEPSFAAGAARKSARVGRQDPTCRA